MKPGPQTTPRAPASDTTPATAPRAEARQRRTPPLENAHAQYRELFDGASHGILILDAQTGAIQDANPYLLRMLGYGRQELVGCRIWEFPSFDEIEAGPDAFAAGRANQTIRRQALPLVAKGGRLIEVDFESNAYRVDQRTFIQCHIRDIAGRLQPDGTLPPSETQLRALFAAMQDVVLVIDRRGVYREIAPTQSDLLYQPPHALLGKNLSDVFAPDKAAALLTTIRQVLNTKQTAAVEYELRINGQMTWFAASISSMGADSTLWVAHDITDRKRLDADLRSARTALETANLELQQSLSREEKLARTDGLTGLPNRLSFQERAGREFQAAIRYGRPLTVMMFDVDDFKRINDSLGHDAGDRVLALIARTVTEDIRTSDILARFGGDEFILLLPETGAQQSLPIAERIRARVAAMPIENGKGPLAVTLSIGIADLQPESMNGDLEQVSRRADQALYRAKESGRNRVCVDGDMASQ